jgi:hypothetical protein
MVIRMENKSIFTKIIVHPNQECIKNIKIISKNSTTVTDLAAKVEDPSLNLDVLLLEDQLDLNQKEEAIDLIKLIFIRRNKITQEDHLKIINA